MVKFNNGFMIAVSLVALLQTSSSLHAELGADVLTESIRPDSHFTSIKMSQPHTTDIKVEGGLEFTKQPKVSRNTLIKEAALFADASYNDTALVAKKMSPLRQQEGFEAREALKKQGYKIVEFNATIPDGYVQNGPGIVEAGIVGYKEVKGSKPQIVVAFHGSECVEDFTMANLLLHNRTGSELGLDGNYHGGFYDRYMQGRAGMMNAIMQQLSEHGKKIDDVDIVVTGHSLGGAIATIAAADLKKNIATKEGRLHLVTFSSPKVTDDKGAKALEKNLGAGRILRVARDNDPVVLAPLGLLNYLQLGFLGYTHVGHEVILETESSIGLNNHNMANIVDDLTKEAKVKLVKFEDIGTKAINAVISAPRKLLNYCKNAVSSLFSK